MPYYTEMGEGAALNYLAGLEDAGDLAAIRTLITSITAGSVTGDLAMTGSVTAAASSGVILGSGGPKMLSGTGSPGSVVTAPVGSIYFQTGSTVGVTHWRKASGTGNTGWVVMSGDTGRRNIAADLLGANGFTGVTAMSIRRVGNTVMLMASQLTRASTGAGNFYTIPLGFRPDMTAAYGKSFSNNSCYASGSAAYITMGTTEAGLSFTYTTNDAWPTSLPGVAA